MTETHGVRMRRKPAAKNPPPRTPWGDPDLQGVWTSDGEMGLPFERATQYGAKQVLEGEELEQALDQRQEARVASAPVSGGETGAGPTHWFESWTCHEGNYAMKNILSGARADEAQRRPN